ncbi:hypothetical protein ABZT34_41480 [Streptomyces sp. NPDC005329]|uniref:hypothetical protein n=1 Tax=Streptomyces sp. NPDC005329 TaxID=3157034 RepID=UPI0033A20EF2
MTVRRTTVRSRNHVTVSGHAGGPVAMPAHGFGCDQNIHCPQLAAPEETAAAIIDFVRAPR